MEILRWILVSVLIWGVMSAIVITFDRGIWSPFGRRMSTLVMMAAIFLGIVAIISLAPVIIK